MTTQPDRRLTVFDRADDVARAAADEFRVRARAAVEARGRFTVALSGGRSPDLVYESLCTPQGSSGGVPWSQLEVFWGDERPVPPDHPDSNYGSARRGLLSRAPIPPDRVHRMRGEADPSAAADAYAAVLRSVFELAPGEVPRFDLILLGLGPDAHTASLFPGSDAVHEGHRLVVATWVEKLGTHRITLSPIVLNAARAVLFLVLGQDKADALRDVLEEPIEAGLRPAQVVQPTDGEVIWLVDRAAAQRLSTV